MPLTWFLGWVMNTVVSAAEAEMNDDTALREQLLDAEMRREMGEITDEERVENDHSDSLARSSFRRMLTKLYGGQGPVYL